MADYVGNQLALYRPLATPIPIHDVSGLLLYLTNYRTLGNAFYDSVNYQDAPGVYIDLKTKIDSMQGHRHAAAQQILSEQYHYYAPQITKRRPVTEQQPNVENEFVYAPQAGTKKRFQAAEQVAP